MKQLDSKKKVIISLAGLVLIAGGIIVYKNKILSSGNDSIVSGNGRVEATEVYIATKVPGRLKDIIVSEGELVKKDQVLAIMDTLSLEAQLKQLHAQLAQSEAQLEAAKRKLNRSATLVKEGASSQQDVDDDRTRVKVSEASRDEIQASIERIQVEINDSTLKAPRDGRVQYLISRPGEVLSAGGRILNLLDLSDVYMTFFLPTEAAGRVSLNSEARIIVDAAKDYVIPAKVSFIASEAQFTPKTVETANEREKLMFRVKVKIPTELLSKYIEQVKTGLPGVGFIKLDQDSEWPEKLQKNLINE